MQPFVSIIALSAELTLILAVSSGCNPGASPAINSRSNSGTSFDKTSHEVLMRVTQIVAETLHMTPEEVNLEAPLSKQKNPADELDVVEIVMMIEEHYQIQIKDEELGGTLDHVATNVTVRKLADIVVKQKTNK